MLIPDAALLALRKIHEAARPDAETEIEEAISEAPSACDAIRQASGRLPISATEEMVGREADPRAERRNRIDKTRIDRSDAPKPVAANLPRSKRRLAQ